MQLEARGLHATPDEGEAAPPEGPRSPRRRRAVRWMAGLATAAVLLAVADRVVMIRPGAGERVVVSQGGEAVSVYGPGQTGWLNPFRQSRTVYDTALAMADRTQPARGMAALSAEGFDATLFGSAFWREGDEADIRWRYAHTRNPLTVMPLLMAASAQAVLGRFPLDQAIREAGALQAALTEDLRARARALLHVEVEAFMVTGIDPGDRYRQVVAERELGKARAAAVATSPAVTAPSPYALEVERIRRWDGRGVIPAAPGQGAGEGR